MLPKENRLQSKFDFDVVKSKGKYFGFTDFGVLVLKRRDNSPTRVGFVVSKKISKLAVARNRIKRVLRESVRNNLDKLGTGVDMVFLVKKDFSDKKVGVVEKEVLKALSSISVIK